MLTRHPTPAVRVRTKGTASPKCVRFLIRRNDCCKPFAAQWTDPVLCPAEGSLQCATRRSYC